MVWECSGEGHDGVGVATHILVVLLPLSKKGVRRIPAETQQSDHSTRHEIEDWPKDKSGRSKTSRR